jgi:hypothetical protein
LVCIAVLVVFAPSFLTAGEAAASSRREQVSVSAVGEVQALPAISLMAQEPLPAEDPSPAEGEFSDDSPLDLNLILLAGWLPIAAALLALAMEGVDPEARRAREPGGEPSLD